jgi:hypothetical protein
MNCRPFFLDIECASDQFSRHLAERRAFGNAEHAFSGQHSQDCFQSFRAGAVALDRFCHDDGDHGDFGSHPEFKPRHHDGQTAIPDRERQRNPGQVAAEIGKALPT